MICSNRKCKVMSAQFHVFESAAMDSIRIWMGRYTQKETPPSKDQRVAPIKKAISRINTEIKRIESQLEKAYELLEQGIYDIKIFQARRTSLESQLDEQKKKLQDYDAQLQAIAEENTRHATIIPKIQTLFDNYDNLSAEDKNHMYKEILNKITYKKDPKTRELTLEIFPRL